MTVYEPPQPHTCRPPRHRPKNEWRTIMPPTAFLRAGATPKPMRVPTAYPAGTVWRCGCGRAWVRRPGPHYGRNPNGGHTEGGWTPVRWYHWLLRHRVADD
jgi:hypothetical protein